MPPASRRRRRIQPRGGRRSHLRHPQRHDARTSLNFFFDREWNRVATEDFARILLQRRSRQAPHAAGRIAPRLAAGAAQTRSAGAAQDPQGLPRYRVLGRRHHHRCQRPRAAPRSISPIRSPPGAPPRAASRATTAVGSATLKTIVRKNLILRLVVPRFFVQGDEVVISALVHNYLTTEKTARVSLDVKGLDVLDGAPKDVRIAQPRRSQSRLARARAAGRARQSSRARRSPTKSRTRWSSTLPVNIAGRRSSPRRAAASLADGGDAAFDLTFPDKVAARFARRSRIARLAFDRRLAVRRARLPDFVPLRLRGADDVELPAQHRRAPGGERSEV